ncbi:MAG: hypothetical protein KGZ88_15950 [Methylomicrobium sp.]|nr:hypothetical protein [Methylomicrobium sp.]
MKARLILNALIILTLPTQLWAYGSSSSSKKACEKPYFSEFVPPEKAEVAVGSEFSFTAATVSNPESIKVTIKNQPVDIKVTPKGGKYNVSGKLPNSLAGSFARINIAANGPNQCKGTGGWLIKVNE